MTSKGTLMRFGIIKKTKSLECIVRLIVNANEFIKKCFLKKDQLL